jgi:hypothetical protein
MGSTERLEKIGYIIEKSARTLRMPIGSKDQIAQAAEDWDEIIGQIPTADLEPLYVEAMQDRNVRGPFQPQEMLTVWRTKRKPSTQKPSSIQCGICEGVGWQLVVVFCPTLNRENTRARPCGCSSAPQNQARSPLTPPEWVKRESDGAWLPAVGEGLQCTCFACERSGRFSRRNLQFDSRDFDEAPCIR